ncbi:hypothetical protein UFOVP832_1, partial [uncultured Caudovirales phage]
MAQVRAKTLCFVDNGMRQAGDVFEYDGPKNTNLEFLKGAPVQTDEVEQDAAEGSTKK